MPDNIKKIDVKKAIDLPQKASFPKSNFWGQVTLCSYICLPYPLLRYNRRNQLVIRDIKCGIIYLHLLRCHTLFVPHVGDLLGRALLDADVGPGRSVHVDGRAGGTDVEGDAVVFGEDGDAGGADFIRDVAACGNAVTADEDGVDPAVLHDGGCHVVADECNVHAGSTEFVCGEACALQKRARLVGEDFEVVAFLMAEVHDGGCGAVFGGGELPCIAVGEETVAGLYEGERMLAYFFTDFDVFLFDAQGFITEQGTDFCDGFSFCALDDVLHAVQRPREIDGGGAGGVEVVGGCVETTRKLGVVVGIYLKRGEVDADGSGVADGGRAAYLKRLDRRPDLALCFEAEVFGLVRQFGLVDDDEGALLFVEGECFHVENVFGHCVPHFV